MFEIIGVIVQFIPFFILLLLANGAENPRLLEQGRKKGASFALSIISHILLGLIFFIFIVIGILISLLGWIAQNQEKFLEVPQVPPEVMMDIIESLPTVGLSFWLPSLLGMLLFIPAIRRIIARLIPIDPNHRVHTISLASSMTIWIYFFFFVAIGLETLSQLTTGQEQANTLSTLWAQQITFFFLALVGVGWLTRRNTGAVLKRLGLNRPTLRHLSIGVTSGLLLVFGALSLEYLAQFAGFPNDPHVEQLTDDLLGPLFGSALGILTLGFAAALGEEAIFRGALLPRFGLFFTSLLFAVVHSNYGLSLSTVIVFFVGLALGFLRQRYDTTTTMIVHATYNITLGILTYLSI